MLVSSMIKKNILPYNSMFPRQSPLYCRIYAKYIPGDNKNDRARVKKQNKKESCVTKMTESEQEVMENARRKPKALQGYDEELSILATHTYSSGDESSDDEDLSTN